jgi:hypothetical protein
MPKPSRTSRLAHPGSRGRNSQVLAQAAVVLAALLGSGLFLVAEHEIAGRWGFSLDDSWIYATFARNLATGHGYSFNPGEPIGGATGPLYVFLLVPIYLLFHTVVWPSKILGIACLCVSSVLVYRTVAGLSPGSAIRPLLAGLLLAISPSFLWAAVSGMEIPVYLLVACLGLREYARGRWTLAVAWWSLGVWLRPDGLYLAMLGLFARPGLSPKQLVRPSIIAACLIGSFFLFNQIVGGHPFPNSVPIKTTPQGNPFPHTFYMIRHWAGLWGLPFGPNTVGEHCVLLLPALAAGAVAVARGLPAIALYALATPIVQALVGVSSGAHGRYIMYVIPFGLVLATIGLDSAARRFGRSATAWIVLFGIVCLSWQVYTVRKKAILHGWNVQNINNMQVFMAERIRRGVSPGDTLAVNDVGAMGYFSGCYIVDLVGLVSPRRDLPENLTLYRPKLMAVFPDWFGKYVTFDPKTGFPNFYSSDSLYKYAPVVRIGLRQNTISARNTMVLFERLRPEEDAATEAPAYVR